MEVILKDIKVMYVVSQNGPMGSPDAFKTLEDAIGWELKGRKFYGTMLHGEYRANLAVVDENESKRLGIPTWTIPGGKYYKTKNKDWEKHILEIAPTFAEMIKKVDHDTSRSQIEFYRSQKELLLFVPIK